MAQRAEELRLDGKVAIVTGAAAGLGRSHALALARHGAKVVVNDLGDRSDPQRASEAALGVVAEINAAGGEGYAVAGSVNDEAAVQSMVDLVMARWGRVDILINNAGILRDKTFAKMSLDDFRLVLDVHLMGSVICTKAVWPLMVAQRHGRIVMTTSSSGLYGNFGQSNYSAAKMGLVGLMQTLAIEGAKHDIRVNCIAPTAATAMTAGLTPSQTDVRFMPEAVSPAIVVLASQDAPTRMIICAGAGGFEAAHITLTHGVHLGTGSNVAAELLSRMGEVRDRSDESVPMSGIAQTQNEVKHALAAQGA